MAQDVRAELVQMLPKLRRFAIGLAGNLDDADDLVQGACERALSHLDQWQAGTRLDSWMYRIIQNLWIDRGRSHKLRGDPWDPDDMPQLADPHAHRTPEIESTLARVLGALGELPPDQREVLLLVGVSEHSYREAAEQLGVPLGTVMSRLARARLHLHDLMSGARLRPGKEA
jgi:RNA polymerase sigma-70 factor (ECF subfamily)